MPMVLGRRQFQALSGNPGRTAVPSDPGRAGSCCPEDSIASSYLLLTYLFLPLLLRFLNLGLYLLASYMSLRLE